MINEGSFPSGYSAPLVYPAESSTVTARPSFADTVRVQITANMSAEMRQYLIEGLEADENSLYEIPEPLGKTDLMAIATAVARPDLKYNPWKPEVPPALADPSLRRQH